ncbi:hypothetical protein [Actinoallomurus sp. NPDC050550]|uniref:hypothetical protein n=1 Tax=Actinoallomurus sp. NPDC050550 TaxID=3154937 RepID=UPI0033C99AFF
MTVPAGPAGPARVTEPPQELQTHHRHKQKKEHTTTVDNWLTGKDPPPHCAIAHATGRLSIEIVRATGTILKEKEYQVRQPFSGRRLGAATALTAVTLVGGGLAMAPAASAGTAAAAPAKRAAAASAPASAPGSKVTPNNSATGCKEQLKAWGYGNALQNSICWSTWAAAFANATKAFAVCTPAMIGTGVPWKIAGAACYLAAFG